MSFEFLEAYEKIFEDSQSHLQKALCMKLKAMKHCHDYCEKLNSKIISDEQHAIMMTNNFEFQY